MSVHLSVCLWGRGSHVSPRGSHIPLTHARNFYSVRRGFEWRRLARRGKEMHLFRKSLKCQECGRWAFGLVRHLCAAENHLARWHSWESHSGCCWESEWVSASKQSDASEKREESDAPLQRPVQQRRCIIGPHYKQNTRRWIARRTQQFSEQTKTQCKLR